MTIHILEDDPAVSEALAILLEQYGHETIAYPDAETFLAASPPSTGDLVIVDLILPGISGVQVMRWLLALSSPPRVVVISGQSKNAIGEQLRDISAPMVIRKPLTEDKIAACL